MVVEEIRGKKRNEMCLKVTEELTAREIEWRE